MANGPYDLLSGVYRKQLDAFADAARDPAAAQARRLAEILSANAQTELGRHYHFASIHDFDDYRQHVPVHDYDDLAPWLERQRRGERNMLTADPPRSYVRTSGTTGTSKWIPITAALEDEVRWAQLVWLVEMLRENPKHPDGVPLTLVSKGPGSPEHRDLLPVGANTGRMRASMPWFVRWRAVPQDVVLAVTDPVTRRYLVTLAAAGADVGNITTANATTLLALVRRLRSWVGRLSADLRAGGVPQTVLDDEGDERPLQIPTDLARRLRRSFKRRPRAAARLEQAVARDPLELRTLWPRLTTVNCWRGGMAPFFLQRLEPHLGGLPVRDPGYSASEGFFAVTRESGTAAGPLHVGGPVFEFAPPEGPTDQTLLAHELEDGAEYQVIVTTCGGLYRYRMGDVVRVEGRWHETPQVAFVRKTGGILNATGEKVTEAHATSAVTAATAGTGVDLVGFTMTLRLDDPPAVVLLAELGGTPPATGDWARSVDEALRVANEEYDSKRDSGRMAPLEVRWLTAGSFERLHARRAADGAPETQIKVPAVLHPDSLPPELETS